MDNYTVYMPIDARDLDYSALQATPEQLWVWTKENMITINQSKTGDAHLYLLSGCVLSLALGGPSLPPRDPLLSAPFNSSRWIMCKRGHAGTVYITYDNTLTILSLLKLSARHREALKKLGRDLLHHPHLCHLLPP
ncbi:hypothetical protein E2C01_059662 [Portunus trituberculatus]|uniref:Uncharacterized protein n=1 Tax=Portunus trituberculatus TaxID=210409 RepID=A0A5B7H7A5_PORTR|nr:hypothetical protein [Portunus trituberculatus]